MVDLGQHGNEAAVPPIGVDRGVQTPINNSFTRNPAHWTVGKKAYEVAFFMNWEKDDPVLFDPTYFNDLYSAFSTKGCHPDLDPKDGYLSVESCNCFLNFVCNLIENDRIKDHYQNLFSKDNTDRLRQMMLAIMNLLNVKRAEPHFKETYASVVVQVCLALDTCSNGINTNVEAIFMNLALPTEGNIGNRVKLALQIMRDAIFRKAIYACISTSSEYMQHEAASVSYYYQRMSKSLGLPSSIASLDVRYMRSYAMRDQEIDIFNLFCQEYIPLNITKYLLEIIHDPYDQTIPTKVFTDWVETRYPPEARYDLLDEDGRYKPEILIRLLKELEVLN